MGYIYLGRHGDTDLYRIGCTNNPCQQIAEHKLDNPSFALVGLYLVSDERTLKAALDKRFADKWIDGAWFRLDQGDLRDIESYVSSHGPTAFKLTVYSPGNPPPTGNAAP